MACVIDIQERAVYLYVVVTGDNTIETIRTYSEEVRLACIRTRKFKVLIVVDLQGEELSMLNVYKAVSAGSDEAAGTGMRVAYVDRNQQHSVATMLLAENVATTRGIPVRTFRDESAAESWLLSARSE